MVSEKEESGMLTRELAEQEAEKALVKQEAEKACGAYRQAERAKGNVVRRGEGADGQYG